MLTRNQIEDVFFNLVVSNNMIDVNIAYTFLPDEIDQKLKADRKLNFKKDIDVKDIQDIKLLFNIVPEYNTFNVDFEGTEALRQANKNTLGLVRAIVSTLLVNLK